MNMDHTRVATILTGEHSGREISIKVYLDRGHSVYWASWPVPVVRNGRAGYEDLVTGDHETMVGAMEAALESVGRAG